MIIISSSRYFLNVCIFYVSKKWATTNFQFGKPKTLIEIFTCLEITEMWQFRLHYLSMKPCRFATSTHWWIDRAIYGSCLNVFYQCCLNFLKTLPSNKIVRMYIMQSGKTAVKHFIACFLDWKRRSHYLATSLTRSHAFRVLHEEFLKNKLYHTPCSNSTQLKEWITSAICSITT